MSTSEPGALPVVKPPGSEFPPDRRSDDLVSLQSLETVSSDHAVELPSSTPAASEPPPKGQDQMKRQRGRIARIDCDTYGSKPVMTIQRCTLNKNANDVDDDYDEDEELEILDFLGSFSTRTRLVILEDLGAKWTSRPATRLKIPKYVSALHSAHPHEHLLGKVRAPLGGRPDHHFVLNYRQPLAFKIIKSESSEVESLACHAQRTIVHRIGALRNLQTEDVEFTEQLVSYFTGKWEGSHVGKCILSATLSGNSKSLTDICDSRTSR